MQRLTSRKYTAKATIDRAIRAAFATLDLRCVRTRAAFERTLRQVRSRSQLLRPVGNGGRIETREHIRILGGLLELSAHHRDWLRPVEGWRPDGAGPLPLFSSLARHVLSDYPVPDFMVSVWLKGRTDETLRHQGLYKHMGVGRNIRTADLPLPLTKMMAHHFVQAPAQYTVEMALRWGQVRGLGGSKALAGSVAATRLGRSFDGEDFWSTVVHFFVNHPELDSARVGPIVDYLHDQRFVTQEVFDERDDRMRLAPPQPNLSMKGRTPDSLLRQVAGWHERLRRSPLGTSVRWGPSAVVGFDYVEEGGTGQGPRRWTIRELLSGAELFREGQAMQHCVASYLVACVRGETSIWSLRFEDGERRYRVMTIEVDPMSKTICQARRRGNARPNTKVRGVMERWARQEGLSIAKYL